MPCLESHGKRLVAPPVRRQDRAEEVRAVSPNQLPGVVRQDVDHVPGVRSWPERTRGGHSPVAFSDLTAGKGRGGRREPSGRGRLYGNMHHNRLGQCHLSGTFAESLILRAWMVSGVQRVRVKDGGVCALRYQKQRPVATVLCRLRSARPTEDHLGFFTLL